MSMRQWTKWVPVSRPGYLGLRRNQVNMELNALYGINKWDYGWRYFGEYYHFYDAFYLLFYGSYTRFFTRNSHELADLEAYDEVVCHGPTDIYSGFDPLRQQGRETHLADIAIRHVMKSRGLHFHDTEAKNVLYVTPGHKFHPGQIPFFVPDQILKGALAPDTSKPGSVDDFWQSNKFVMVHPDAAPVNNIFTEERS